MKRSLLLLALVALGCSSGNADASKSSAPSSSSSAASSSQDLSRFFGRWTSEGGSFEISADRYKRIYNVASAAGGKPVEGPYKVVSLEGDVLVIDPKLDLGDGKSFPGDQQRLTLKGNQLDVRNVKNDSGSTYTRAN